MATHLAPVEILELCAVAGCTRSARRLVCDVHARRVPLATKQLELTAWMRWQRAWRKYQSFRHPRVEATKIVWQAARAEVLSTIHGRVAEIPRGNFFDLFE